MRTVILTLALSILNLTAYGQARVNRAKLSFQDKSSRLTEATGWSYNSTLGEWIDYPNVISSDKGYKTKWKSLQGDYMMSKRSQNFIDLQTKTIFYEGEKFYVVIVHQWHGRYKYPSIQEDWIEYKQMVGYIFTELEFNKIKNLEKEADLKTKKSATYDLEYEEYDETKFLDLIQTELSSEEDGWEYTFPIRIAEEGEIRFYVPEYWPSYRSGYDFDKEYFETTPENFQKIII